VAGIEVSMVLLFLNRVDRCSISWKCLYEMQRPFHRNGSRSASTSFIEGSADDRTKSVVRFHTPEVLRMSVFQTLVGHQLNWQDTGERTAQGDISGRITSSIPIIPIGYFGTSRIPPCFQTACGDRLLDVISPSGSCFGVLQTYFRS
jgi:hypothetical protein